MKDIMIDLETLGIRPGSAIVSIGAVYFSTEEQKLGEEFYCAIDLRQPPQLLVDMDTLIWWTQQSEAARYVFDPIAAGVGADPKPLEQALGALSVFARKADGGAPYVWGNGANFDNVVLAEAYRACHMPMPWPYYNDRCYRTVRALLKDREKSRPFVRVGVHHNALDDAKSQALHLMKLLVP